VKLIPLPCDPPPEIPHDTVLVIAFPVYAQSAPPFVLEWLKQLPNSKIGNPVIVISTMAGASGLVKAPLARLFRSKGYLPRAVKELIMPTNYISQTGNEKKNEAVRIKAEGKIADFAEQLINGRTAWPYRPGFLLIPARLCSVPLFRLGAAWLGKGFTVNKNNCNKCLLCSRLCPVNNINFDPEDYPVWGKQCQQCLRCLNFCPKEAVSTKRMSFLFKPTYCCPEINAKDLLP